MNIEMNYHNVYYYCSIVENIIEERQMEFLTKLSEFSKGYLEEIPEEYNKESILLLFCRWSVKEIMEEDMQDELKLYKEKFLTRKGKKKYEDIIWSEKENFTFEVERAIEHYYDISNRFCEWIEDKEYELLEDAFYEYLSELWFFDKYENVVNKIADEMFYILFLNRNFLLLFNYYISLIHDSISQHIYIPKWVKNAVFYRDRGRCVLCGKDLSGTMAIIEYNKVHYDHIVPLDQGGINDVSNIQLLCEKCNLTKGTKSITNNIYQNWFDEKES